MHYRRRSENTGFKAGNVMDFLGHHATGLDYFLCLDADSEMTPAAAEYAVTRHYIDWILALPWEKDGEEGVKVYDCGQGVYEDRKQLSELLGLPERLVNPPPDLHFVLVGAHRK